METNRPDYRLIALDLIVRRLAELELRRDPAAFDALRSGASIESFKPQLGDGWSELRSQLADLLELPASR